MPENAAAQQPSFARFRPSRRLIIIVLAVLGVYAAAGFLLAPWIIKSELVAAVGQNLGLRADVARVELNPFTLSLRIAGFELHDRDGSRLVGLDELFVNFQLSSIFRRALTFAEVRLSGPYVHAVRDHSGALNLQKLVPPDKAEEKPPEQTLPRLILQQFALTRGVVDLEDQVPTTPFKTRLGPVDVRLQEFSTLPDESGQHSLVATLESGTEVRLSGKVGVTPVRSDGQLTIKGPLLPVLQRYLRDELNFELAGGSVDLATRFTLGDRADGSLEAGLDDLNLAVTDTRLREVGTEVVTLPALKLTGGKARWPAREVTATNLAITGLHVVLRRAADGTINLARLLGPKTTAASAPPPDTVPNRQQPPAAGEAWKLGLGEFELHNMGIDIRDESLRTPAELSVVGLDLTLKNFSNEPGARFDLATQLSLGGGGTVGFEGAAGVVPDTVVDGQLRIEGVKLTQAQGYVSDVAHIHIQDGALGLSGHLTSDPKEQLSFVGDVKVSGLNTVDIKKNERLLAWSELNLDDLRLALTANSLRISRVRLIKPYARVFIAQDQTTNVGDLMVEAPPAPAAAQPRPGPEPAPPPFRVRVGKVAITAGSTDYTDLSLPLPFAAHIVKLNGNLTAIDSRSQTPSRVSLEGQVGEYGLASIKGQLRASAPTDLADITLVFRNIEMPPLSSYSIKFAGYKIAGGRLNMDLRYHFDNRHMVGENKIMVDQLELGEKVPNPDAIDLPLGLAIALLKDADGRIDLDLPVTGSLDDPQFSVGGVLWKAFVNLMTKIVTSPFRLLGKLIGSDSEEFGQIAFPAGRAELLPPEREKLLKVATALAKRPTLGVEIPGAVDPAADGAALQATRFDALVEQGLQAKNRGRADSGRDLEARTREIIQGFYAQSFPGQPLKPLQEKFTVPPPDNPSGRPRLDEVAYVDELRRQLIAAQPISPADLDALATARATAISDALASAAVPAGRVKVGARKDVKVKEGADVPVELQLGGA